MGKPYFQGIPTRIDVDLLIKEFGVPKEGAIIGYAEIAKAIKVDRDSNRFKTVTTSWRKLLFRQNNVVMDAIPNEGFLILPPPGRVQHVARKGNSGMKLIRRAGAVAATTERRDLSPEDVASCDHYQNIAATLSLSARVSARRLPKGKALEVSA